MVTSVQFWKRSPIIVGLLGVILAISSCSGTVNTEPTKSAETKVSQEATVKASPSVAPTAGKVAYDNTVELGDVVKTTKGEYTQVKLPQNSPIYKYSPDQTDADVKAKYSEDEIVSAQKFIADFVVAEVIDTPLNGAGETPEQWWERNKDKISDGAKADVHNSLGVLENGDSKSFVAEEPWQLKPDAIPYSYTYEVGVPRVTHLNLTPTKVFIDNNGGIAVNVDCDYRMPFNSKDKENTMFVTGSAAYSVIKNDKGDWVINGYKRQTTSQTLPL